MSKLLNMRKICIVVMALAGGAMAQAGERTVELRHKLADPEAGVFVVAHRGCHNGVPAMGLDSVPENSLAALERCVLLHVDMMETDIRRTRDGALVIMHDDTIDRTTDGTGAVADLTLAQIRRHHLRRNMGAPTSMAVTGEPVPTLDELLARSKGRILINLDIKDPVHREVIEAAIRDGVGDEVVAKRPVTAADAVVADSEPFRRAPFVPILEGRVTAATAAEWADIVSRQSAGSRRIPMIELALLSPEQAQAAVGAARKAHVRVMADTLSGVVGVVDWGADEDALRDPVQVWGRLIASGVSAIQTDEPAALLDFLKQAGGKLGGLEGGGGR